jgi:hypothetical protein
MCNCTMVCNCLSVEKGDNFSASYFSQDERKALYEEWEFEEKRLNTTDICGFNEGGREPLPLVRQDSGLTPEQLEELKDSVKKYRSEQRKKIADEAEKESREGVKVAIYPNMIKVSQKFSGEKKGGGIRGKITRFSTPARRRLIHKFAMVHTAGFFFIFLTVTYPLLYFPERYKKDLDAFCKRIEKHFLQLFGCVWKLEYQQRGAGHFHFLLFCTSDFCSCGGHKKIVKGKEKTVHDNNCELHGIRKEISYMWADVVRNGYEKVGGDMIAYQEHFEKHLKAGTNVEALGKDKKGAMVYLTKYIAKTDKCEHCGHWDVSRKNICKKCGSQCCDIIPEHAGRIWGFRNFNGNELNFEPDRVEQLNYEQGVKMKRTAKKWLEGQQKKKMDKYAKSLTGRTNYSVLGLGSEAVDSLAVYRMVEGAKLGLFTAHITRSGVSDGAGAVRWEHTVIIEVKDERGNSFEPKQYKQVTRKHPIRIDDRVRGVRIDDRPRELTFIDRVKLGLVAVAGGALVVGSRVRTPNGLGTVASINESEKLKRKRFAVVLDGVRSDGSHWGAFDVWQLQPVGVRQQKLF